MVEKISIGIELEGAEKVTEQLERIMEGGQKTIDKFGKAAEKTFDSAGDAATKFGEAAAKPVEAFGDAAKTAFDSAGEAASKFGEAAAAPIAAFGDAATKTAEAVGQLGKSTAETAESYLKLAEQVGHTGEALAKNALEITKTGAELLLLIEIHRKFGAVLGHIVQASNLAVKAIQLLAPEFEILGAGLLATTAQFVGAVIAFEAIEKAATKFAAADEKLNHELQTLATTTGQSFNALQQGQAAFEQIGLNAEKFRQVMTKISDTAKKGELPASLQSLPIDQIEKLALALANGDQALLKFIHDADELTALKVGAEFGLTESDVDRIRRYGGELSSVDDLYKRLQASGVALSAASSTAFNAMRDATQRVESAWARLDQAWKSTVFTTIAAQISAALNNIKGSVIETAASILETFNQLAANAADVFSKMLQGWRFIFQRLGAELNLQEAGKGLQLMVGVANQAVADIVGGVARALGFSEQAIKGLTDQIKGVAPAANDATTGVENLAAATSTAGQAGQQASQGFLWMDLLKDSSLAAQLGIENIGKAAQTSFATVQSAAEGSFASLQAAAEQTGQGFQVWSEELGKAVPAAQAAGEAGGQAGQQTTEAMNQASEATSAQAEAIQRATSAVTDYNAQAANIDSSKISESASLWDQLTSAIGRAIDKLLQYVGLKPSGPSGSEGAPGAAGGGLIFGRGSGTSDSNLAWVSRGEHIMPARIVRQPGMLGLLESLRRSRGIPGYQEGGIVGASSGLGGLANKAVDIAKGLKEHGDSITASIESIIESINQSVSRFVESITDSLSKLANMNASALDSVIQSLLKLANEINATAQPKARGGLLGGRGTGTSDSNLAWISRGEFIMPAHVVRQPGMLAFLEALRHGMGFALGGLVPRFAAGGEVGGMSHVTIQFPGLSPITGLRASSAVIEDLRHAAALAQVRSGGRKPSRYS